MRYEATNDADRAYIRTCRVLLDGIEQDIMDLREIDTDGGIIRGVERPLTGREWTKRGRVEVVPK